jgi:hypothetical protein
MRPQPGYASARNVLTFSAALVAPIALATLLASGGCGGPKGPDSAADVDGGAASASTTTTASAPIDAGVAPTADAAPQLSSAPDAAAASTSAVVVDAGPPPPCWAGFKATGNAVADVNDLGGRCTKGMSPVVPPVKQSFAQGEKKQIPLIIPGPGCYRIIAVGGTGVKDVDLEVRDGSGKLVAADNTPDDIFPMIHPNKEWCPDAAQFLTLSIIVKKGAGEVAGGVWKR